MLRDRQHDENSSLWGQTYGEEQKKKEANLFTGTNQPEIASKPQSDSSVVATLISTFDKCVKRDSKAPEITLNYIQSCFNKLDSFLRGDHLVVGDDRVVRS